FVLTTIATLSNCCENILKYFINRLKDDSRLLFQLLNLI
ncbi:unnamed protein product, partial [Callosobruchus maculatus]